MGKFFPYWRVSPNIFLLGAGASLASFPNGDKYGRKLPLMHNFISTLNLNDFFEDNKINIESENIEEIYSSLYSSDPNGDILKELNEIIINYFSLMKIPDEVTLYDELLLSLQKKDVILSFNWDPLLLQAYNRNIKLIELPEVHFLHGNVLEGVCLQHSRVGYLGNRCSICNEPFSPSKILFPIKNKEYDRDSLISETWDQLRYYLKEGFIFSIFGYSAPSTDVEAKNLMLDPWVNNKRKELNEVEIIDIKDPEEVENNWEQFIYSGHRAIHQNIRESLSFRYARRSCEAWGDCILQCDPWPDNPLPKFEKLNDLHSWVQPLIDEEIKFREKDIVIPKSKHFPKFYEQRS